MDPIIIIGAGYGGLCTAFELAKRQKELAGTKTILIDRCTEFVYTPLLYEVATGFGFEESIKEDREVEMDLARGSVLPYEKILSWHTARGIQFKDGDVIYIDFEKKEVVLSGGEKLPWSYLVIAIGAETDFYDIPGLKENVCELKTLRQALAIRRKLRSLVFDRQEVKQERPISVAIGGAGATGVELGAELLRLFKKLTAQKLISQNDFQISIVEAANRLLPAFDQKFSDLATKRLGGWGIKTYLDTCIKSVEDKKVILTARPLRDGERAEGLICEVPYGEEKIIDADVLIWTGGIRAPRLLQDVGLNVDKKGRIEINDFCEIKNMSDVYAIGDVALLVDPKNNKPVPALGQAAIAEAHIVAKNICASIIGGSKSTYRFPYMHTAIPSGAKYALVDFYGFKFRGFFAWIIRQLADLKYFLHILPSHRALSIWLHGLKVYGRND